MSKNYDHHHQHMYELCKNHMQSYVLVEMTDGSKVDGIITGLDDEHVYMAVPINGNEMDQPSPYHTHQQPGHRQFGYPGYGPGYGYGYGFGYPGFGRPRRFQRLVLPLAALAALSILPWY